MDFENVGQTQTDHQCRQGIEAGVRHVKQRYHDGRAQTNARRHSVNEDRAEHFVQFILGHGLCEECHL